MMAAFGRIGTGEKVQPSMIAAEISIALICTAMGLGTAIPFNFMLASLTTRIRNLPRRARRRPDARARFLQEPQLISGACHAHHPASISVRPASDELIARRPDSEPPEFDITAMVDLVFMMNIYFLVTFVTVALGELNLPAAKHVHRAWMPIRPSS